MYLLLPTSFELYLPYGFRLGINYEEEILEKVCFLSLSLIF